MKAGSSSQAVRVQAKNVYANEFMSSSNTVIRASLSVSEDVVYSPDFSSPTVCTQQLTLTVTWCIRHGATFRMPVSTLQRPKKQGGWNLIDIAEKCRAFLLSRMVLQSQSLGTVKESWLQTWNLTGTQVNPLLATRITKTNTLPKHYAIDIFCVSPPGKDEKRSTFKWRLNDTLNAMTVVERGAR